MPEGTNDKRNPSDKDYKTLDASFIARFRLMFPTVNYSSLTSYKDLGGSDKTNISEVSTSLKTANLGNPITNKEGELEWSF